MLRTRVGLYTHVLRLVYAVTLPSLTSTQVKKTPPFAFDKNEFYLVLFEAIWRTLSVQAWYSSQPCGENKLSGMVRATFSMIGITGKTNHSPPATGALEHFQAGASKNVQKRTGHHSVKALHLYKCTTTSQHMAVLNILAPTAVTDFASAHSKGIQAPIKSDIGFDTGGDFSFSLIFGSASDCVINVNRNTSASNSAGLKEGTHKNEPKNETF